MGLDIYVGPLCRYYTGNWQTIIQQWGQSQGVPVTIVRPRDRGFGAIWQRVLRVLTMKTTAVDPAHAIVSWRENLAAQGYFSAAKDWAWPESLSIECDTDKPGVEGYGAVQLWAAYTERADFVRPLGFDPEWEKDPALIAVKDNHSACAHITDPELWLPVEFEDVFEGQEPNANRCKIGSVFALLQQLHRLNSLTWKASADVVRHWRQEDVDFGSLESVARWGFSIWFCLTEYAVLNRLPMRLDY